MRDGVPAGEAKVRYVTDPRGVLQVTLTQLPIDLTKRSGFHWFVCRGYTLTVDEDGDEVEDTGSITFEELPLERVPTYLDAFKSMITQREKRMAEKAVAVTGEDGDA